jgi:hypothetical protein
VRAPAPALLGAFITASAIPDASAQQAVPPLGLPRLSSLPDRFDYYPSRPHRNAATRELANYLPAAGTALASWSPNGRLIGTRLALPRLTEVGY